jgi:small GTP-binding protein
MHSLPGQEATQFKVPLIGDANVGKTSIVSRYTTDNFVANTRPTVGVSTTNVAIDVNKSKVELSVWDTAGQERFRSLVPLYTRHAAAMILVFDMAAAQPFAGLEAWLTKLTVDMGVKCPVIVCGNKIDLPNCIAQTTVKEWADERGLIAHFTSAVTGVGITELFQTVAQKVSAQRENQFGTTPVLAESRKSSCC